MTNFLTLNVLEREVLALLLAGENQLLLLLRAQLEAVQVTSRKYSGVGFFTAQRPRIDARASEAQRDFW